MLSMLWIWILRFIQRLLPTRAMLRLSLYFACVFSILALLAVRQLWARVAEGGVALGHELMGLSEFTRSTERVVLNGVRFQHASVSVRESVKAVLDRVERHCEAAPGALAGFLAELSARRPRDFATFAPPGSYRRGILRDENSERGFVVCLVGDGPLGLKNLAGALERFSNSGDVSVLGRVRYAYAEQGGTPGETRVVTIWTDDSLNLTRMFPGDADSAGSDSELIPRPPHSLRLLSAAAADMPLAMRIYESDRPSRELADFYDAWFREHGFQVTGRTHEHAASAYVRGDGFQVFLGLSEQDGRTTLSFSEAGRARGDWAVFEAVEAP